jgi:hypothetical protein
VNGDLSNLGVLWSFHRREAQVSVISSEQFEQKGSRLKMPSSRCLRHTPGQPHSPWFAHADVIDDRQFNVVLTVFARMKDHIRGFGLSGALCEASVARREAIVDFIRRHGELRNLVLSDYWFMDDAILKWFAVLLDVAEKNDIRSINLQKFISVDDPNGTVHFSSDL